MTDFALRTVDFLPLAPCFRDFDDFRALAVRLGVPELDLSLCATELVAPVLKWGTRGRNLPQTGSWHCYTSDFHFTGLMVDPDVLPLTGCAVAVEANFSTHEDMAPAEILWGVYRKRLLARSWQADGVRIVVDLNVSRSARDLNLLGVPRGWTAYATRAHRGVPFAEIAAEHALAVAHAGTPEILFAVFGGGRRVKEPCRDRGWTWVPEHRQVVAGLEAAYQER